MKLFGMISVIVIATTAMAQNLQTQWTTLPNIDSQTAPAISAHSDGNLHVATVASSGLVATSFTSAVGAWPAWQILGPQPCFPTPCQDSAFYADPSTPPVFARYGNTLYLFARGNDDNLYEIRKQHTANWGANWQQITTDGQVLGRFSVAFTVPVGGGLEVHFLYPTSNSSMEYRRFGAGVVPTGDVERWCNADSGSLGTDGVNEICAVIQSGPNLLVEVKNRPWTWPWRSIGGKLAVGPQGAIHDISNVLHFGDTYHVAYTMTYDCGDFGQVCDSLLHARFRPGQIDDGYVNSLHDYTVQGNNHPLSTLTNYRNKLMIAYKDGQGYVRCAYWDNVDPNTPWVGDMIVDNVRTTNHRPAVAYANMRPGSVPCDNLLTEAFGNDLFAVMTESTTTATWFINFTRAFFVDRIDSLGLAVRWCTEYSGTFGDCPAVGSTWDMGGGNTCTVPTLPDESETAIFSEVGYGTMCLPDWLMSEVAWRSLENSGIPNGRYNTWVHTRPITPYVGPNMNLGYNSDYFYGWWQEMGHALSGALGLCDDGYCQNEGSPNPNLLSDLIPDSAVSAAYTLFAQRLNTDCHPNDPNDTCPETRELGFTGFGNNYDVATRQHSWMYPMNYFFAKGDELRNFIDEDLAVPDTLLQEKVAWHNQYIFRGQLFGQDNRPLPLWNDGCSMAEVIIDGTYSGSTEAADSDGSSTYTIANDSPSVWYRYQATCTGTLNLDLCGSTFDTVLSVHSACPGTAANELAWNDDCLGGVPCAGLPSCLSISVTSGQDYYLRVSGFNGASGDFTLNVSSCAVVPPLPPVNDDCCGAIQVAEGTVQGTLIGASNDGAEACGAMPSGQADVWYSFTAPYEGTLKANTCGTHDAGAQDSGIDTVLWVYDGNCSTRTLLDCNDDWPGGSDSGACSGTDAGVTLDSAVSVDLAAGQTVLVRVSRHASSTDGPFTLNLAFETPANDDCSNAITVTNGQTPGTLWGSTSDGSSSCDTAGQPDVWYRYTVAGTCGTGTLKVNTCGTHDIGGTDTGVDTVVSLHSACAGSAENEIDCNDDWPSGSDANACTGTDSGITRDSAVAAAVTEGQTVWIRVSSYGGSATGPFNLYTELQADAPLNDACATAIPVTEGTYPFCTIGATMDGLDYPAACNFNGYSQIDSDIWYCYTATCTGTTTVDLCASSYDTKLAVFAGCVCEVAFEAGPIVCNDDTCGAQTAISFPAIAGNSYLIRVGGNQGQQGTGTMEITCEPTGACCLGSACAGTMTSSDCTLAGGVYQGDGTACDTDDDADNIDDACDNCLGVPNQNQLDTDGDGVGNDCDNCPITANPDQSDDDGDNVGNVCDNCPNTIPGSPVDLAGCPPTIPADFDNDGDVDQDDVDAFAACASGPAIPYTGNCSSADFDNDNDTDQSDFGIVQRCYTGEDNPGDPNCAD